MPSRIQSRWWRLHNLYYIIDKHGKRVKFKPNWAQLILLQGMWYCNILLKARQLGMTTFMCIFLLDVAMFNKNTSCGIIAHNKEDAEKFFNKKVKYAYDQLPQWLKDEIPADTSTAKRLKFNNESSIDVGTSMRSDTLQYLHISEYGKICAKFPEKAKEIRTGALNAVEIGNYVFIESTAEGQVGDFYKMSMNSMVTSRSEVELTPLDYKFFFFPWHNHVPYTMAQEVDHPQEMLDYYDELEHEFGIILSPGQRNWYTKKWEVQQDEMKREFPSTPEEAFEASVVGSFYRKQLARARLENRVGNIPHDEAALVHTAWDLGMHDEMVLWFFQMAGKEIHMVNWYANTDEGFPHYKALLEDWKNKYGYTYGQHFVPHDIGVREQSSGRARQDMATKLGLYLEQLPKLELQTGINNVRATFRRCWFDKKCEQGLGHLSTYVKKYNKTTGTFVAGHEENGAQHSADAFRYLIQAVVGGRVSNTLGFGKEVVKQQIIARRDQVNI